MRLLFDEQLAEELCDLVRDAFPNSLHIRLLGYGGASDDAIWQLAHEQDCLLVTKDEDFHRLSVMRGAPPKVIWIRLGNCTTVEVATVLVAFQSDIRRFVDQDEATFLELGRRP